MDFDDFTDVGGYIYSKYPTLKVYTNRGFHLYYKKPKNVLIKNWTNKLVNAGITVDYKTSNRAIGIIKQNGYMRELDNGHLLGDWDNLPSLPFELYPSKLSQLLYQMKDGDGRNSSLFTHLLTMREMYKPDDKSVTYIAAFINEYVFQEPMKERELQRLIESVLSKNIGKNNNKYLNPKDMVMTSEVLVEKLDIKFYQHRLYFKQNARYISDDNLLLRAIDRLIQLKPSQHKELLTLFEIKAERIDYDDFPIQLRNGYIIDDGEVIQVDTGFTPFYLDVDYDPAVFNKEVDEFLNFLTCERKDLRMVIEEMFGHMLMTRAFPHKVFFFQGSEGKNGKSTIVKMIKNFISESANFLPLDKFDDDTSVYSLVGKLVNIGDDIDASYLDKSSNFKTLASGDPIMVRPIYKSAVEVNNKATLIFTCNDMPIFKDKSGGIMRRVIVIPCDNVVTNIDNEIDDKLSSDTAKSYLLNLALTGIERIKANGTDISESITIKNKTKQYFIESDNVAAFIDEYSESISGKRTTGIYAKYVAYCTENGLKEVGSREFGRRLSNAGFRSKPVKKDGKTVRIYDLVTNSTTNQA
ncbi:phage/plasmid primase, P4 family [Pueribacillus theae]|uniref:phage/plasmid primase, P4 family n=1 Tax=Pueribacillus theae TaxID=2171751 RepID=UPI001F0CAAF6|nr:phage/plasmid primase, P4 family [Pueribacillus theae]